MIYDTIIIGAGAAGCSAAIYATRYSLKTLMFGGLMPGGLITEAMEVENYPGYLSISGMDLANKFLDQAKKLGAEYKAEVVESIIANENFDNNSKGRFTIRTSSGEYQSRTVILAMGTQHRKLGIKGEQEFAGKGVSYCATCDGPFFKNKVVAVSGGGNSAVEAAQDLSNHASKVYLIYRSELKAAPLYIEQMKKRENIIEIPDTNVIEVRGENLINSLLLDRPFEGSDTLAVGGFFVQIGYSPKNDLAKSLGAHITEYGYVKVDSGMGTNIEGLYCAGDLNDYSNMLHQQVTSAAEGAIAAQSAYKHTMGLSHIVIG